MKKVFLLTSLIILLNSCHKSERDNDRDITAGEDVCRLFAFDGDVFLQLHEIADTLPSVNKVMAGCVTANVSGTSYPKTVTLDFGTVNCAGTDGVSRRGIITAVFSGKYKDSLTTITVTTNSFYQNDNKIDVTKTITNKGRNSANNIWFTETTAATILLSNQKTISYSSNMEREWTAGSSSAGNFSDDLYLLTGSGSGTGTRGNSFEMEITSPVTLGAVCRWPTQGSVKVIPANLSARTLDFGSGSCDSKATLNVNGYTSDITLP